MGSPVATYQARSASDMEANRTVVRSMPDRQAPFARRQTPVTTSWARPARRASMTKASSAEPGLPRMWPSQTTSVSAASTGSDSRRATAAAFARARRSTAAAPSSPGRSDSSSSDTTTRKLMPRSRRMRARRGEAEARTSFGSKGSGGAPESGNHVGHQGGGPAPLEHEVVGAVEGAGLLLALHGEARIEDDGNVHPLHRGLDRVDHGHDGVGGHPDHPLHAPPRGEPEGGPHPPRRR